jgi:hypothetical protein
MVVVSESNGRAAIGRLPAVTPRGECHQDDCKFPARFRQGVVDPANVVAVPIRLDHAPFDERAEAVGEHIPTDAQIVDKFVEPVNPHKEVSHDKG